MVYVPAWSFVGICYTWIISIHTYNLHCTWCAVFADYTNCCARVSGPAYVFCILDQHWVIGSNRIYVSTGDFLPIFCPRNGWCWYATGVTLNRNASIGKCCHIITNSDNKWLLVLKFHRYWFCRDPYFWFRGACTKKIDNFRIRREKRLALRKSTCSTELRTPIERYKLYKLLKEKGAGLIPSSDKKSSCKGKLRSHFKFACEFLRPVWENPMW